MMNTAYNYDRLKFDILDCKSLSTEDVGKRFTVTYWMKSDKTEVSLTHCCTGAVQTNTYNHRYSTIIRRIRGSRLHIVYADRGNDS